MTDLEWTNEPPQEEGWYFIRIRSVGGDYIDVDYHTADDIQEYSSRDKVRGWDFAGPIPRPSDPHQNE